MIDIYTYIVDRQVDRLIDIKTDEKKIDRWVARLINIHRLIDR